MVALTGCLDAPDADPTGPERDTGSVAFLSMPDQSPANEVTRWDSPWWNASDEELVEGVAEAGGRVAIGFKEPESEAGVDTRGHRLISPGGVHLGRQLLETHEIEIRVVYNLIPAVSAVIDPELAPVLRAHPRVDYVEPWLTNFRLLSSDTISSDSMWAAEAIQAPLAWDSATGAGVTVGVVDTGIMLDHPYLDPVIPAHDCIGGDGNDSHGHGTHVSGLIAASLSGGQMTGAAYGVTLRSYRVGGLDIEPEYIECGIAAALADGVDIVNMSFGGDTVMSKVADAIATGYAQGMLFVGAGGNASDDHVVFPANMSQVIAVLAVDQQNQKASGVPSGPHVELVAPGVYDEILTTCLSHVAPNCKPSPPPPNSGNGPCLICRGSASSFAAPLVSAAAALLQSHQPGWTRDEIRARLRATALDLGTPGRNNEFGYGLVQAYDALTYDLPPSPTVEIQGPDSIDPSATCTWNASVTDGIAPFSYSWFVHSSSLVGSEPSYTGGEPGGNTGNDFNLYVVVTDHVGRTTQDEIIIELDESAPPCLI